jgi:hypothetical protein
VGEVIERIARDLETAAEDASYGVGEVVDEATPERWLREHWSEVKPHLIAKTRRGARERRIHVLGLLAFLQQDLGERLDLDILWRALDDQVLTGMRPGERLEVVLLAFLWETHGSRSAALHVRAEGGKATLHQMRAEPAGRAAPARVWELEGKDCEGLLGLLLPVLGIGTLKDLQLWVSEPGPVSVQAFRVVDGQVAPEPALAMAQTTSPWWDEVVLKLFEAVEEPSRLPARPPRAGDLPPRVLEAMEAMLARRGRDAASPALDTR